MIKRRGEEEDIREGEGWENYGSSQRAVKLGKAEVRVICSDEKGFQEMQIQ